MKKRFLSLILMAALVMVLSLSACNKTAPQPADIDADAAVIEQVAKDYLAAEMGQNYDKADVCIPWAYLLGTEVAADDSVTLYGDFWVDNYGIKGDTLENVSGGNYPGVMQMKKDGDSYKVTKFDQVEDGSNYTDSAKKLFSQ